jgi:tRNA pseudouridine38-40 synthase
VSGSRNIRLLVEYEGTGYVGWQHQETGPSIQGALQAALEELTGERPQLYVAGRTDAGVHAVGQVVSFVTHNERIASERFAAAFNNVLPPDISVHRSDEMPVEFHARFSAKSKRYRYRVYQARQPAALEQRFGWWRRRELDVGAMSEAARALVGEHDFESFRSAQCDAPHARRRMFGVDVTSRPRPPAGVHVDIIFWADAFARHMCRVLAGTLVEIGAANRPASDLARLLEARDRTLAGVTAPPHGLTLLEVLY